MKNERTCGFWDATFINTGWAIATWCFLTGALTASLVDFKTAIFCTVFGNMLGVMIMLIAEISVTVKYGIDTYPAMVSFLGRNGMKFMLIFFVLLNLGWVAVLSLMFSRAVQNIYEAISGNVSPPAMFTAVAIIAVLITWLLVYKGVRAIAWMNRIVVPCLAVLMIVMFYFIMTGYGADAVFSSKALAPYDNHIVNIILCIELNVGAGLSWYASLGSLTRTTKTSRGAMWANVIGVNFMADVACLLGAAAAYVIGGDDPTTWMIPLGGLVLGGLGLIFVMIGNITSNAIVMYATCLGLKQFKFFAGISWLKTTALFVLPVLILLFFPDFVYGNYQILLNGSAAFFASLAAVQFVDFIMMRKGYLDLRSVYNNKESSAFRYWGGVNWGGFISIIVGGVVYCLLLNPLTWEYSGALLVFKSVSIPAFLVAGILYLIWATAVMKPSGKGSIEEYKRYFAAVKGNQ